MKRYTAIIADDNEIDRLAAGAYLRKYPAIEIGGIYGSAEEALADLAQVKPDVLFLDIDMPGLSGLELRKQLMDIPACIFITSHPEYAVESFELAALDFLVKPLSADRFAMTMARLESYLELLEKSALFDYSIGADTIFIKDGYEQVKLKLSDITYLEALKDYTSIVTSTKKFCVHAMLGNLLKEENFSSFIRIHRSYAVQKNYIDRISGQQAFVGKNILPVGRLYKENLESWIVKK